MQLWNEIQVDADASAIFLAFPYFARKADRTLSALWRPGTRGF